MMLELVLKMLGVEIGTHVLLPPNSETTFVLLLHQNQYPHQPQLTNRVENMCAAVTSLCLLDTISLGYIRVVWSSKICFQNLNAPGWIEYVTIPQSF